MAQMTTQSSFGPASIIHHPCMNQKGLQGGCIWNKGGGRVNGGRHCLTPPHVCSDGGSLGEKD
jgi:hypothetical protein